MELAIIKNNNKNRDNNGNDSEEQLEEGGMEVQLSADSVEEGSHRDTLGGSSSNKSWWNKSFLLWPTPGIWVFRVYFLLLIGLMIALWPFGLNAFQDVYHIYYFFYKNVLLGFFNVSLRVSQHYWKIHAYLKYDEHAFGSVNEDGRPVRVSRLDPAIAIFDWETDRPNKCCFCSWRYFLWSGISGVGLGYMLGSILRPVGLTMSIWGWVWVGSWQLSLFVCLFLEIANMTKRMRHEPNRAVFAEHGEDGVYHVAGTDYYYKEHKVVQLLVLVLLCSSVFLFV